MPEAVISWVARLRFVGSGQGAAICIGFKKLFNCSFVYNKDVLESNRKPNEQFEQFE